MIHFKIGILALLCLAGAAAAGETAETQSLAEKARAPFEPGEAPPFLGIFTHTDATYGFADTVKFIQHVNANNPHIVGYAFRTQWRVFHPEKDRIDWEGLEAAIDAAASAGKLVSVGIMAGGASPDWIYEEGCLKAGPLRMGSRILTTPLPWDPTFIELYLADLEAIAERYADDPRVMAMEVVGPTYNYLGEEFHAPAVDVVLPFGWSRDVALSNWKFWIDQYSRLFPNKKLYMIPSQMYRGEDDLPAEVVKYFVEQLPGRAYFQTHQLTGKSDFMAYASQLILTVLDQSAATHELMRPLKFAPEQQGSPEMSLYQIMKTGKPFYIQLWSRDAEEPKYAKMMLDAWEKYGELSLEDFKQRLIDEGLYVERSDLPGGYTPYDLSRLPPAGYPGHEDPFIMNWSPFQ